MSSVENQEEGMKCLEQHMMKMTTTFFCSFNFDNWFIYVGCEDCVTHYFGHPSDPLTTCVHVP
jgi:hypothetical protein